MSIIIEFDSLCLTATEALHTMETHAPRLEQQFAFCEQSTCSSTKTLITTNCSPPRRSSDSLQSRFQVQRALHHHESECASFDLSNLVKATEPVEKSISFPVIEWSDKDSDGQKRAAQHCSVFGSCQTEGLGSDNDDSLEQEATSIRPLQTLIYSLICSRASF